MNFHFKNKKISGIVSVVPKNRVSFMDEIENYGFSKDKSLKLKETMGFDERRIVAGNECTSDLCLFAMEYLIENRLLEKNEISALIFVTQTPDHFLPPTSSILHGKLELDHDVLCMDINQGCSGYLYGLLQAFMILEVLNEKGKVVLLNGDTLSRCACPQDRNIFPLIGDAGAVTIIEDTNKENDIFLNIKTDGSRSDWLIIPAGAFRYPSSAETRMIKTSDDGNKRSDEHFSMKGAGVFTFTQKDVPVLIKQLLKIASTSVEDIDYFMFHQPNRFMLNKLAQKLGATQKQLPRNIVEKFGNSSSATIPLNMCFNISGELKLKTLKLCMSGFGVGLSWGALVMNVGPLDFCELIEM